MVELRVRAIDAVKQPVARLAAEQCRLRGELGRAFERSQSTASGIFDLGCLVVAEPAVRSAKKAINAGTYCGPASQAASELHDTFPEMEPARGDTDSPTAHWRLCRGTGIAARLGKGSRARCC